MGCKNMNMSLPQDLAIKVEFVSFDSTSYKYKNHVLINVH